MYALQVGLAAIRVVGQKSERHGDVIVSVSMSEWAATLNAKNLNITGVADWFSSRSDLLHTPYQRCIAMKQRLILSEPKSTGNLLLGLMS